MGNLGKEKIAYYHLPGLFEFYDLYSAFLPLYREHREYFYDWCEIGSIYGAPADCLWGGGRTGFGEQNPRDVALLMQEYEISARLTFSNSLLTKEHLSDRRCNELCRLFENKNSTRNQNSIENNNGPEINNAENNNITEVESILNKPVIQNGIIIYSDLLLDYIRENYPGFYFVSTTTKVITDFQMLKEELDREDYLYVVPDFRFNKDMEKLNLLSDRQKDKAEFLCNECCYIGCSDRKVCYENVSRKNLGENCPDHICRAPGGEKGYRFSAAMENPAFIGIDDIREIYMPMGFTNFKIEGRGLGSAVILEFLLYYMTKPEHQLKVREEIYLDSELDLF